jgi:phosphopantothenate synthetase
MATIADRIARRKREIAEFKDRLAYEQEHQLGEAYANSDLGKLDAQMMDHYERTIETLEKIIADLEARPKEDQQAEL